MQEEVGREEMMPAANIPVCPQGTSMSSTAGDKLSVASFNLLAPLYIRPVDQRTGKVQPFASFDWISDEDSDRILGNECRLPKLLRRLLACGCDFICVQELQLERGGDDAEEASSSSRRGRQQQRPAKGKRSRKEDCDVGDDVRIPESSRRQFVLPKWIAPLIESSVIGDDDGPYKIILPPQAELEKIAERNRRVMLADVAITNAIFYKSGRWSPSRIAPSEGVVNTTTCVVRAFFPADNDERGGGGGGGGNARTDDPIAIASVHLDARSEERRVQQLRQCIEGSLSFSTTPYPPPCIIAGDYNSELFDGSCIGAFLGRDDDECDHPSGADDECASRTTTRAAHPVDGGVIAARSSGGRTRECASALRLPSAAFPSTEQSRAWDELHDSVGRFVRLHDLALRRIDTGCTRAAYDHDDDPSRASDGGDRRTMAQWHLDHILYTPSTLMPLVRWTTLDDDEHSRTVGLPNEHVPTDHLPIAAAFERRAHPRLCEDSMRALIESMDDIESRHNSELKSKEDEIDRRRAELEKQRAKEDVSESTDMESMRSGKDKRKKKGPPPTEMIEHIRSSRAAVKELKSRQRTERQEFVDEVGILERMVMRHLLRGNHFTCSQWIEHGRPKCAQNE
ncbi:hypothetical protein ACHAW5_000805 [Stephanodiscus triporus]|uniref:Endonuclease/exonuclease/phosphatase domain-containing protein n=1 Tax=Stephanodiscus triporus TaxID=2934178 RepID=A0ABD3MM54_9STRA